MLKITKILKNWDNLLIINSFIKIKFKNAILCNFLKYFINSLYNFVLFNIKNYLNLVVK